jgi:hypothetical protein
MIRCRRVRVIPSPQERGRTADRAHCSTDFIDSLDTLLKAQQGPKAQQASGHPDLATSSERTARTRPTESTNVPRAVVHPQAVENLCVVI